jgi:glycosyltransferase involved in cell wall biosynthesis
MDITSELVNASDISLVTFSNLPILQTNSPNKLFDSLSAEKPIIVNSAGWTKALVEDHNCGFFVDPADPVDCADKILNIYQERELLIQMGKNSRELAMTKYDKGILCKQVVDIVESQLS